MVHLFTYRFSKDLLGEIQQDSDASVRYEALCSLQKIIDRVGDGQGVAACRVDGRDSGIPGYRDT